MQIDQNKLQQMILKKVKTKKKLKLNIKKFNMSTIKDSRNCLIIGKRATGKNMLARDILYHQRDIPVGTIISPTSSVCKDRWNDIVPSLFIHDEYNEKIVSKALNRQKKIHSHAKNTKNTIDQRAFLVFDQCLYDHRTMNSQLIRDLCLNTRRYQVSFINIIQCALDIAPPIRANTDYIFIFRENTLSNRKRLYEDYASIFPSFNTFCQVLDQCTQNYECMVIDNTVHSDKIEDKIFWYKAEKRTDFTGFLF
jgi:hypothetical protein